MDDKQFCVLLDALNNIADNLRRIAFEIENFNKEEEKNNAETTRI